MSRYLETVEHSPSLARSLSLARRRHPHAPVVMMLVVGLLWLLGQAGQLHHEARVAHVHCAEHGDLVELHGETAGDHEHQAGWQVDDLAQLDHDHGCPTQVAQAGGVLPSPPAVLPLPRVQLHRPHFIAPVGALAPPLVYAPKTSPPVLS